MRPAGEQVGKDEQWLAYHALSKHIRHSLRDHRPLVHADPRTRQTTLYSVAPTEIAALTQAPSRPERSDRWIFIIDAITQAVYRYRVDHRAQNVQRVDFDLDFSIQLDDALHAPRTADSAGFLSQVAANIHLDLEHGTNFAPIGQPEASSLMGHLRGFTPVSFEEALDWRPSGSAS